jgi:hypothetical protein
MNRNTYIKIAKSKLFGFIIQLFLLILIIFFCNHHFQIESLRFEIISPQRRSIIQFLGNLILYNDTDGQIIIYTSWLLISFVPILIYREPRPAFNANIKFIFFVNFFFYIFTYKYLPNYFNEYFWDLFLRTLILSSILIFITLITTYLFQKIKKRWKSVRTHDLQKIAQKIRSKCPNCGTEFNSQPVYCYNCSSKLFPEPIKEN